MSQDKRAENCDSAAWLLHETIYQQFEEAWKARRDRAMNSTAHGSESDIPLADPEIDELLPPRESEDRIRVLVELIKIDMEYRWKTCRVQRVEEYIARFPELGATSSCACDLIEEEIKCQRAYGSTPSLDEFTARFPDHSQSLQTIFSRRPTAGLQHGEAEIQIESVGTPASLHEPLFAPGTRMGKYELGEELGRGTFATVLRGRDLELCRDVAIKVPRMDYLSVPEMRARFVREAQSAARLCHPGIVPIHEVCQEDRGAFIVYELISGASLAQWLSESERAPKKVAELVAHIAEALDYAHQCGIIHRDVKPGNVLMDSSGRPRVADFGLALQINDNVTLTQDGDLLGTPAYMSPEQARGRGHRVDARTDVYSLGVILYEALSGQRPFIGSMSAILHQVIYVEPRPIRSIHGSVPRDLETICHKCLRKEPNERYPTARALANDLRRFLEGDSILARPMGSVERVWRWGRRHPAEAVLTAVTVCLMIGTVIGFVWYRSARLQLAADRRRDIDVELKEASTLGKQAATARDDPLRWQALLTSALASIRQAEVLVEMDPELISPDLRDKVHALKLRSLEELKDCKLIEETEQVLIIRSNSLGERAANENWISGSIRAFENYGVTVVDSKVSDVAERIRARPVHVRDRILDTLFDWLNEGNSFRPPEEMRWVRALIDQIDDDPFGQMVWEASQRGDKEFLESLADGIHLTMENRRINQLKKALERVGCLEEALELRRRILQRSPDDFWTNFELGSMLDDKNRSVEAVPYLMTAVALRPSSGGAYCNLGNAQMRAGDLDGAISSYERAIELQPDFPVLYSNLGVALQSKGYMDKAIRLFNKAIELWPEFLPAYLNLGPALRAMGDLEGAIRASQKATQIDPQSADAHINLGVAYQMDANFKLAIAAFEKAKSLQPTRSDAFHNLGVTYYNLQKDDEAVRSLKQAIRLDPEYAEAYCVLGLALQRAGQLEEAHSALRKGHELGRKRESWDHPSGFWLRQCEIIMSLRGLKIPPTAQTAEE